MRTKKKSLGGQQWREKENKTNYMDSNLNPIRRPVNEAINETEQSLLDGLATGVADFGDVKGLGLEPEDFNSETHRLIFRAMEQLYDRGEQLDTLSLNEELSGTDRPDGGSWGQYIMNVLGPALPIGDVAYAVGKIKERTLRRKIEEQSYRLYEAAKKDDIEGVQRLFEKVSELLCHNTGTGRLKPVSAADLPDIEPPVSLWGGFIYPGCVTQLNAEPGAGKSTVLYNIAVFGAQGKAFIDIPFPKSIKTLYVDLETPQWLRRQKIKTICGELPKDFHLLSELNLRNDLGGLIGLCKAEKYDLIVFDTQSRVLAMGDENDNSEANRAADMLGRLAKGTGAAVHLNHHTNKSGNGKGVYRGRGASALAAAVDIVVSLETLDAETLKLKVEKSRVPGVFNYIAMRKVGYDRFERISAEENNDGLELHRSQDLILNLLGHGGEWRTGEIVDRGKTEGLAERTIKRALDRLRQAGKLSKVRQGVYLLNGMESELYEVPDVLK